MIRDAYISKICKYTYACEHSSGQQHALRESTCWSREVWGLRSHPDTMRDMCGNHTRQLIVVCDKESSSPHPESGMDKERHVPVWR